MLKNKLWGYLSGVALLAASSIASASTLVNYKPTPVSPTTPEFLFQGGAVPSLQTGPGSIGNGDGQLPEANQTAPGLESDTPFIIPGVPGSIVDPVAGTTNFYDTSLLLTGLQASAA